MIPYYISNDSHVKLEVTNGITSLICGYCERDFLAKLKENANNPVYDCPRCSTKNRYNIVWQN